MEGKDRLLAYFFPRSVRDYRPYASVLDALWSYLFGRLAMALRDQSPDLAAQIDAHGPIDEADLSAWVELLPFAPVEPWTSHIAGVFSVELGLRNMSFVRALGESADEGEAAWFAIDASPLVAASCFERMHDLTIRMSRGPSPLIDPDLLRLLTAELATARAGVDQLRNDFAHGPSRRGSGGWLAAAKEKRSWELMALSGEDGSALVGGLIDAARQRGGERATFVARIAVRVALVSESVLRRILAACEAARPAR